MSAVARLKHVYANRDEAARDWHAKGGKVVGYFEDNVPEELILAAGFMPYRLSGDPHTPTDTLKQYLYPFWKKHSLSDKQVLLGFTMSMLDLIFRGRYDFLDYLVIPYSRKGVMGYWSQLSSARKAYPDLPIPEFTFLDRAITPGFDSSRFNQDRIEDFIELIETWAGETVSETAIAKAAELTNAIRSETAALATLRAEGRVSGADALAIIGAGRMIPRAEYLELLRSAVSSLRTVPPRLGPKLFLAGSPQDNDQLYRLIEGTGATVVGENHYWGNLASEYPVDLRYPPLVAVGDMYHKKPAVIVYPLQRAIDETVKRAQDSGADGVVFSVYEHDYQEIWIVPDTIDALKEKGLPSLYLSEQPYLISDPEAVASRVSAFTNTLGGKQ